MKYYSDYYNVFILKKKDEIEFLAINHNNQLSEKFIYSDYKVNCVRKEPTSCLITPKGMNQRDCSSEGMDGPSR